MLTRSQAQAVANAVIELPVQARRASAPRWSPRTIFFRRELARFDPEQRAALVRRAACNVRAGLLFLPSYPAFTLVVLWLAFVARHPEDSAAPIVAVLCAVFSGIGLLYAASMPREVKRLARLMGGIGGDAADPDLPGGSAGLA